MQVYLVNWANSEMEAFRNFADIEKSIRITFSQATELAISHAKIGNDTFVFDVSGRVRGKVEMATLNVRRLAVYDSPTHL